MKSLIRCKFWSGGCNESIDFEVDRHLKYGILHAGRMTQQKTGDNWGQVQSYDITRANLPLNAPHYMYTVKGL